MDVPRSPRSTVPSHRARGPKLTASLLAVAASLLAGTAAAQAPGRDTADTIGVRGPGEDDKAMPCRPTVACTADIVPEGSIEVEAGYAMRSLGASQVEHSTPFLLKLSMTRWLQAQVGGNGAVLARGKDPSDHFDNVGLGLKARFVEQGRFSPSLALSSSFSIPATRAKEIVHGYNLSSWAYVSKDIGPVHADYNAALNLYGLEKAPVVQGLQAFAVSVEGPLHLIPMTEIWHVTDAKAFGPRDAGVLLALAFSPKPWLVLDAGVDIGLFRDVRGYTAMGGVTFIPVDFWESKAERRQRLERVALERNIHHAAGSPRDERLVPQL